MHVPNDARRGEGDAAQSSKGSRRAWQPEEQGAVGAGSWRNRGAGGAGSRELGSGELEHLGVGGTEEPEEQGGEEAGR